MNFSKLVADYIRSQWVNFHRALIEPQAQEELLCGASALFVEPGSTVPVTTYADAEHVTANANPVVADVHGNFPPIHLDMAKPVALRLLDMKGEVIFYADDARQFTYGGCPNCGRTQLPNCGMFQNN